MVVSVKTCPACVLFLSLTASASRKLADSDSESASPTRLRQEQSGVVPRRWTSPQADELFDLEQIDHDRESNQVLTQSSWAFGSGHFTFPSDGPSSRSNGFSAVFKAQSKRHRKQLRGKIQTWFTLFSPRVVEFEFAVHIRSRAWLSPTVGMAIRSLNIIPYDSPIFGACWRGDLSLVKALIESGAASINDMAPSGFSPLEVCTGSLGRLCPVLNDDACMRRHWMDCDC
jgi:hypothetical protein